MKNQTNLYLHIKHQPEGCDRTKPRSMLEKPTVSFMIRSVLGKLRISILISGDWLFSYMEVSQLTPAELQNFLAPGL